MAPMKELGTPRRLPCHTFREAPQDTSGFTSQARSVAGLRSWVSSARISSQLAASPSSPHRTSSSP